MDVALQPRRLTDLVARQSNGALEGAVGQRPRALDHASVRDHFDAVDRVAAGRLNAEIARELNLTTGTVANLLGRIYRKLGVRNRAGLIRTMRDHRR